MTQFAFTLMTNFMLTVQYNRYLFHPGVVNVTQLCDMMENALQTLHNYVDVSQFFLKLQGRSCVYNSYDGMVQYMSSDTNPTRAWTYQTCTQTGYFQTTDSPTQPFGTLVPLAYFLQLCHDSYGLDMTNLPRVNEVNNNYGGDDVRGATPIMFVNCDWDEWSSLSIVKSQSPSIVAAMIQNGSHCCDMNKAPNNPLVAQAQLQISRQLGVWMAAAPQAHAKSFVKG